MSIAVIADAHLGGPGGPAAPFIEQLEHLADGDCRRLVLLGDIFHIWIGHRHFETAEIGRVLPVLRRLRQDGLRIDYIEGNRDFFLAQSPYRDAFDSISTELAFVHRGRRYLAVHGDGLNDHDRQYLFWRWLSKSPLSRLLVGALPAGLAQHLVLTTERRLSQTNFKHKIRIPAEAIQRYGTSRLADHDVLLLGHFHEPRTWRLPEGEIRLVDAWFNRHHIEWLDDERVQDRTV